MTDTSSTGVTRLLLELKEGNEEALKELAPLIYEELRVIASRYLKNESKLRTIQTTDLVHEAYIRMVDEAYYSWENRAHFFSVAARSMRQFLIYYARRRTAAKRGGGKLPASFNEEQLLIEEKAEEVLAIDEALIQLKTFDERMHQLIELRYFTGLTIEETAEALSLSPATVKREWVAARAWLKREIARS